MTEGNWLQRFEPWRKRNRRRAYIPVLGKGASTSHFGGSPRLVNGKPWPICDECQLPMHLLLELDLGTLPRDSTSKGIVQLFYCQTDDGRCETWDPYSGANLVRLVEGALGPQRHPAGLKPLPRRQIVDWKEIDDYPSTSEHEALGIMYHYNFDRNVVRIVCDEVGFDEKGLDIDEYTAEEISTAEAGDKLFGWPLWIQDTEYPICSDCGRTMNLLFQVDSECGVPLMFGDAGTGHITQCPNHPEELAFGWSCS